MYTIWGVIDDIIICVNSFDSIIPVFMKRHSNTPYL